MPAARARPGPLADGPGRWTRPVTSARRSGRSGTPARCWRRFAAGQEWEPLSVPIRGPSAREIGEYLAEVRQWAAEWAAAARGPLRVEYKQVGGRHFGANSIPGRAWLDSYDDAWALLRAGSDVRRLAGLIEAARGTRLVPWLIGHPMRALRLADDWDRLLATVGWIEQRQAPGMYLRQVDVPGVDTKFIERHKGVLTELLDAQLDPSRVDSVAPDFAGRYGFLRRPGYVRFQVAGGSRGFSELSVRASEFTAAPEGVSRAYVIENEITYLAFPVPAAAMVIFGGGYAVPVLEPLGWLAGLDVVLLGRHRHARLRDSQPAAPPPATRPFPAHGPGHPAGPPGPLDAASRPRPLPSWAASTRPSQLSTPTSSRMPTARPSAWNRNGSASLPSRKQSLTVDRKSR